ncbi:MAG: MotE family protein [Pseudomonadota bacterium]
MPTDDVATFCANIIDPARERRYAEKNVELKALQRALDERLEALEERRKAYEAWRQKRDEFAEQAQGTLVAIYAKMRPDAAAERLELLPPPLAAAIVMKLKPGRAGTILNEMGVARAAAISNIIAAAAHKEAG